MGISRKYHQEIARLQEHSLFSLAGVAIEIPLLLIQGQAEIMEIIAVNDMKLVNIPLKELDLPEGVLIAGIHRGQKVIIPDGETKILEDDKVIIFCLLSDIAELEKLFRKKRHFI